MATTYLAKRNQLVLSIHIVDSRHEPTKQDLQLHEWLEHSNKPRLIVATKSDKLSNNELRRNLEHIARVLDDDSVVAYSAKTGRGREELWRAIKSASDRERLLVIHVCALQRIASILKEIGNPKISYAPFGQSEFFGPRALSGWHQKRY